MKIHSETDNSCKLTNGNIENYKKKNTLIGLQFTVKICDIFLISFKIQNLC